MTTSEETSLRSRNPLRNPRRKWSRIETRTLLVYVHGRKEEFHHVARKKHVHDNLVEDMSSAGVSDNKFTASDIRNKLKALKMAYKTAVDNNNRTGAAPSVAPFMDLLDEIYGSSNLGPEATTSVTSTSSIGIGSRDANPPVEVLIDDDFDAMIEISIPEVADETSNTDPARPRVKRNRCSTTDKYLEKKLLLKEKALKIIEENKFKRFREKESAKEKRHLQLLAALKDH